MSDYDDCEHCVSAGDKTVRSSLLLRTEAFSLYMRLQTQGYLPSMCENRNGKCRVCYSESEKISR